MKPLFVITLVAAIGCVVLAGCKKEEPYPPARYAPYGTAPTSTHVTYPPYGTPGANPGATPPAPTTTGAAPPGQSMPPALGFPCVTDQEPQCLFGRCVQGRCGGCVDASQCKPGAACAATPFGMACVWAAGAVPTATTPPGPTTHPPTAPPPSTADSFAQARALCVSRTNAYRASVGAAPVQRRTDQEACTDREAASDAATGRAHGAFGQCGERAQNECPGWPGPAEAMIERCLQMMFDEGPGEGPAHGHYNNMVGKKYTGVACGFHQQPDGSVWVVQNFYP